MNFHTSATSGGIASGLSASTARSTAGLTPARSAIATASCVHGPQSSWRTAVMPAANHGLDGEVPPELSERGDAGKQPCGTRTRVDHVAHIAGVVLPVPLELLIASRNVHLIMVRSLSTVRRDRGCECDTGAELSRMTRPPDLILSVLVAP